ncbi:hypothetical protein NY060_20885, partial [Escherichia coli]
FAVTHHAFSSGAGRTSDGNGSHASTLKSPSYTKSVSWQHYQKQLGKYLYHHDKYVIYLEVTNHQHFLPFFPSPGHTDIFPRTKDSA